MPSRAERIRKLCHRLHQEVTAFTPAGLGAWDPAWTIVAEPSNRLQDLLEEWERTGDVGLFDPIRVAYRDVIAAWRRASREFNEAGGLEGVVAMERNPGGDR